MPFLTPVLLLAALYSCDPRTIMSSDANLGANATSRTHINHQDHLKPPHMGDSPIHTTESPYDVCCRQWRLCFHAHTHGARTDHPQNPSPSTSSSQSSAEPESTFFYDAFFSEEETRQSSYPAPNTASNPPSLAYPILSEQKELLTGPLTPGALYDTPEVDDLCDFPQDVSTNDQRDVPSGVCREADHVGMTRIDPMLEQGFDQEDSPPLNESVNVLHEEHTDLEHETAQPLEETPTSILHDGSEPYNQIHAARRFESRQQLVDDVNTIFKIAESRPSNLSCATCGKAFKSQPALA